MKSKRIDEDQVPADLSDLERLKTVIAEHPFLKGLKADHLMVLAECGMPVEFSKGDLIVREGDVANRFYLIQEGQVALEMDRVDGDPIPIQTLGSGEVLGWSWFFLPYHWHFSARAIKPTRAIFFYGTRLRERCEEDHELGFELAKRVSQVLMQRFGATMRQLLEHY